MHLGVRAAALAAVLLLVNAPAWPQATLKQLGPVVSQHLSMYAGNGQVMDAGGITSPGGPPANSNSPGTRPTGLGIVNPGTGYAAFSGYANGSYAELLFGFTESGDGLIKLDRVGDDAPLVLYCEINHVRQPCSGVTTVSIRPGTGLSSSPDPITGAGEIWLEDTAVQPGLYPYASVTVDQQGRIIDIAAGTIPPDPTPPGDPDGSLQYNCAGIFCGASVATGLEFSGGNLALTQVFNDQSSVGYTILTGDGGKTIEVGAHTYTLPQAGTAGFEEHWGTCLLNISGGDATISTTTSVFSGAGGGTSLTLHPGDWACPSSNGTNYPTLAGSGTGSGLGTVTSVATGTGLTGGPITGSGTIVMADTAVTPGSYTYASLTVDQQGRLIAAGNGAAPPSAANPSATAGSAAVNGSASTFMRSDAAPLVQKGSAAQFGIVEVDGTSITASGGVISATGAGLGTVTSVGLSVPGSSIFGATGTPVTTTGTLGLTTTGTSGGIPYFDTTSTLNSSAVLTANNPVIGGGAGAAPAVGSRSGNTTDFVTTTGTQTSGRCVEIDASGNHIAGAAGCGTGSGSVTSVGLSVPGSSIFGATGTPVTSSGTLGLTVTGTSGGIPYFDTTSTLSSSAALTANAFLTGGGAGAAPNAVPITGLVLGAGASAPGAYGGANCTNQFPRSQNAAGAWTCNTVANTDLASSSITLNAGASTGLTAPGAMTLGSTYTIGATTDQPQFAGLGLGGAATGANRVAIYGSTSGRLELKVPSAAGTNALTFPAGTTDFSTTGGTSQFVKQASAGAPLTVARPACADLSDSASGCSTATPTVKGVAAIGWIATANPDKAVVFTASSSMTITAVRGTVADAVGATATIQPYKTASGTACSGGTALTTATFDANGTAVTNQTLTLAGAGAPALVAGDRICLSTGNGANFTAGTGIGGITFEYTVP